MALKRVFRSAKSRSRAESRLAEEKNRDGRTEEKIPEDQPVAALEIGIGFCPFVRRDRVEPGRGRGRRIERFPLMPPESLGWRAAVRRRGRGRAEQRNSR